MVSRRSFPVKHTEVVARCHWWLPCLVHHQEPQTFRRCCAVDYDTVCCDCSSCNRIGCHIWWVPSWLCSAGRPSTSSLWRGSQHLYITCCCTSRVVSVSITTDILHRANLQHSIRHLNMLYVPVYSYVVCIDFIYRMFTLKSVGQFAVTPTLIDVLPIGIAWWA